jgi:hypothetical protein
MFKLRNPKCDIISTLQAATILAAATTQKAALLGRGEEMYCPNRSRTSDNGPSERRTTAHYPCYGLKLPYIKKRTLLDSGLRTKIRTPNGAASKQWTPGNHTLKIILLRTCVQGRGCDKHHVVSICSVSKLKSIQFLLYRVRSLLLWEG